MASDMVGVSFFIKMEDFMTGNGKRIKCMGGGNCFTKEVSWHTKEIGLMTSFMDTEKYIMTILLI
jgi:hypothetical protein